LTLSRVSVPKAEGARIAWQNVPPPVRAVIEQVCGSRVVEAKDQPGGFSPGMAARIRCDDGTRWFVKAATSEVNPDTPELHRQEAKVLAGLDRLISVNHLPVPRLRGTVESGPWFALIADEVPGSQPELPWRGAELDRVLDALDQLAADLTPAPVAVPAISTYLESDFTGWRSLAQTPDDDRIDSWARVRIPELAALEATWSAHAAGETLLHADLRADNMLLTADGVVVVDWPHACLGAAFADLVFFAPSVAMQGGPEPAALLGRSRTGRSVSKEALAAVVCALAGYFTHRSLQPAPPGLPKVRNFQAKQGEVARRWLAALL
jgi:aminoglycoside phosphotransferase (APT) family kinase protein